MKIISFKMTKGIAWFVLVAILVVSMLTGAKLYSSYYATGIAAQKALAQQYIGIAQDIADGLDKETYEEFLLTRQDDRNRQEIRQYLEQFRSRINALYVYVLMLDETDVSKAMVAAIPPGISDIPVGTPCTVPSAQVLKAKNGSNYYTGIIEGEFEGSYLSVGVPFYNKDGELLGVLGIDIGAKDLVRVSKQVISSNAFIFGVDILFAVVLLVVVFVLIRWYDVSRKRDLLETERIYISELEKVMDSIKASRHDFKNHLQVLGGLLDMRMYTELKDYLKQLKVESKALDLSLRIKSPILMVLFQSKWELAHSMNIPLHFETDLHDYSRIESFDLVKIYANLLDNALEATQSYEGEEPKQIRVLCKTEGSKYVFAVENTALLSPQEQKRFFQKGFTTKESAVASRGNGLSIVRQTVEKYQGEISVQYEDDKVMIHIVI